MAFNFNWSPLMADANFYQRAQEMLTTALNKSPKPPIIVDHIVVNELNLGSVPPELEILEIGDLAEDRFRGIFKMCYSGDAFLTLKTKVQANPLNTYLSSTSPFTSPQPLAAASGLMIPLQITLSEIKLSAFIILVFSRQKGLTLVFRNDPLESLKVSSTFDSIPFVRNYLQKEIEIQLRTLMMDELPAIIHRLSLQLWCPEYSSKDYPEIEHKSSQKEEIAINPFASPPQDAVDSRGNVLDSNEVSSLSSDGSSEFHLLFSQKNLLRLSALMDSHRTLSLFTPSIRDAVFRAWATPSDRGETLGTTTPASPVLKRTHSTSGSTSTSYNFNRTSEDGYGPNTISTCPTILSFPSTTGLCLGSTRNARSHLRKKKIRVVNLRRQPDIEPALDELGNDTNEPEKSSDINIDSAHATPVEPEDTSITPTHTPPQRLQFKSRSHEFCEKPFQICFSNENRPISSLKNFLEKTHPLEVSSSIGYEEKKPEKYFDNDCKISINEPPAHQIFKPLEVTPKAEKIYVPSTLIKQSWVLKMASEILKRAQDEKARDLSWFQLDKDDTPPPAYEPKSFIKMSPKKF